MHQPQSPSARLRWAAGTLALLAAAVVIGSLWQRNASPAGPTAPLTSPLKFVADRDESGLATQTKTNDVITYTLVVYGNGISTETMALTDTVGSNGTIAPASASASSGTANISGNTLTWSGSVGPTDIVTITFNVQLTSTLAVTQLVNSYTLFVGSGVVGSNLVTTTISPYYAYLPIVYKPRYVYIPIVLNP